MSHKSFKSVPMTEVLQGSIKTHQSISIGCQVSRPSEILIKKRTVLKALRAIQPRCTPFLCVLIASGCHGSFQSLLLYKRWSLSPPRLTCITQSFAPSVRGVEHFILLSSDAKPSPSTCGLCAPHALDFQVVSGYERSLIYPEAKNGVCYM